MKITKRNGNVEEFNIQKIKNVVKICSNKINGMFEQDDINIAQIEIESCLKNPQSLKTTANIQKELIKICERLIIDKKEIIFQYIGAQLKLYNIEKNYFKKLGLLNAPDNEKINLKRHIEFFIKNNLYLRNHIGIWNDDEIEQIEKMMNFEYDKNFTLSQISMLAEKYLIKDEIEAFEPPQFLNIIQSMCLAKRFGGNTMEYVEKFYNAIASNKISLSTPIRSNLRRLENLTSCFIIECDDNSESILKGIKKAALYSKNGGGVGIYLGRIRPSNSKIRNRKGANNIMKWVKIFDCVAPAWNQNGVRNGAFTISIDIWHKDIKSFLNGKTESGGDTNEKVFNIFPQVIINKQFIEEIKNDGLFPLLDRKEIMDVECIDIANLNDWNENYERIKANTIRGKYENCETISAKQLWKEILKTYIETGELFLAHKDNINKTNPFKDFGLFINSTNLCTESFSPCIPSHSDYKSIDHSCNLISLNLKHIQFDEIEKYCSIAAEILNATTYISKNLFKSSERSKKYINSIGIGVMGISNYLKNNNLTYSDTTQIEKIFESIAYYALKKSQELTKNFPIFELFNKSDFSKGKFLGKTGEELEQVSVCGFKWKQLLENIQDNGCVNGLLISIAPNTTTSILCGASPNYIPPIKQLQIETTESKNFIFFHEKNVEMYGDVGVEKIIKLTNQISKWIDAGISMELIITPNENIKKISDCLIDGFSDNLKTLYYCRVLDEKPQKKQFHCVGCEN